MEDKTMAANLERIHNIYMDKEEKPVKKVALMVIKYLGTDSLKKLLFFWIMSKLPPNKIQKNSSPSLWVMRFNFFAVSIDAVVAEGDGQVVNKWMVRMLCSQCVCTC